jgi:hypothetical protein
VVFAKWSKNIISSFFFIIFTYQNQIKMKVSAGKLNKFLFFKLPSAYLCGVRVKQIDEEKCEVTVKHRWINQNPFNSIYFAVQAMAAELSTGALVINQIQESGKSISMLVANNKSNFTKKATGKITFKCVDGKIAKNAIQEALRSGEGQVFWMKSIGINENGDQVSVMDFEWSVKMKTV